MTQGGLPRVLVTAGALRHVVLLRWRTDADPKAVANTLHMICKFALSFPGVRANVAEPDLGIVDGNWDACLMVDFQDCATWRRYMEDPRHIQLVTERLRPLLDERAAVQVSLQHQADPIDDGGGT